MALSDVVTVATAIMWFVHILLRMFSANKYFHVKVSPIAILLMLYTDSNVNVDVFTLAIPNTNSERDWLNINMP